MWKSLVVGDAALFEADLSTELCMYVYCVERFGRVKGYYYGSLWWLYYCSHSEDINLLRTYFSVQNPMNKYRFN